MTTHCHFRPTRDERIGVVRNFLMCKVARRYEVEFIHFVQKNLCLPLVTKSNLFAALEKYNTYLKGNEKNFFTKPLLRQADDSRIRKGGAVDTEKLQQSQLQEYVKFYSRKLLEYTDSVEEKRKDLFIRDVSEIFAYNPKKEEQSQDVQIEFMMRYCLSEKMANKFVEVSKYPIG